MTGGLSRGNPRDNIGQRLSEAIKTPLTRRIIEFADPEFKILANIKLYDGTTDPEDHLSQFSSVANSEEWLMPVWCYMFQQTLDGSAREWFENLTSEEAFSSTELPKGKSSRTSGRDGLVPYRTQTPYQAPRDQGFHHPRFNLGSLTKLPKEILASEPQLNLQPPRLMQLPPKKENQDKYCDYHGEKGHYTNDCFQLRRQLEMALESGKLNHLIKDVR
nr:reverse transcriptase domain-containing protein [Tanacetum cinerariifolium]